MRRLAEAGYELDQKVYQAQHELAWLIPNLGADNVTTRPGGLAAAGR